METKKKPNRNALRSKAMIRKAFIELMKTRGVSEISVSDVIKLTDLNRATFYAHYSCVRAIADEIEDDIVRDLEEMLYKFQYDDFFSNPTHLLLQVSRYFDEKSDYFRELINSVEVNRFLEKLQEIFVSFMEKDTSIPPAVKESVDFNLRISYFAGGIANTYLRWFNGKLKCSIYDIPLIISKVIENDMRAEKLLPSQASATA